MIKENDRVYRDRTLRVIDADGEQLGIMNFTEAIAKAQRVGMDLVLVSDKSDPVVVRVMDFGKLLYEQKKKDKDQKRKSSAQKVKEIKFSLRINENDYAYKLTHALEFFAKGYKVKVTIQFTGRELAHKEIGYALFARIATELGPYSTPDAEPKLMGRTITVGFQPKSAKVLAQIAKAAGKVIDFNAPETEDEFEDDPEETELGEDIAETSESKD